MRLLLLISAILCLLCQCSEARSTLSALQQVLGRLRQGVLETTSETTQLFNRAAAQAEAQASFFGLGDDNEMGTFTANKCQFNYLSVCPDKWQDVGDGRSCVAPESYKGPCKLTVDFSKYNSLEKRAWSQECFVDFPCYDLDSGVEFGEPKLNCDIDYTDMCPFGWRDLGDNKHCQAPKGYVKGCGGPNNVAVFDDFSLDDKEEFAGDCNVVWPCSNTPGADEYMSYMGEMDDADADADADEPSTDDEEDSEKELEQEEEKKEEKLAKRLSKSVDGGEASTSELKEILEGVKAAAEQEKKEEEAEEQAEEQEETRKQKEDEKEEEEEEEAEGDNDTNSDLDSIMDALEEVKQGGDAGTSSDDKVSKGGKKTEGEQTEEGGEEEEGEEEGGEEGDEEGDEEEEEEKTSEKSATSDEKNAAEYKEEITGLKQRIAKMTEQ